MRGAQVLWGRAHESAGAPPYWPWRPGRRARTARRTPTSCGAREWAPYAVELQRIFPALRDLLPGPAASRPASTSEEAQFRLFDAMTRFLRDDRGARPLVVVLDDLHWADKPSLLLLRTSRASSARARVLRARHLPRHRPRPHATRSRRRWPS